MKNQTELYYLLTFAQRFNEFKVCTFKYTMGIFYFPTDFVYWRTIKEHEHFKKQLLTQIENNTDLFSITPYITKGVGTVSESEGLWIVRNNPKIIQTMVWDSLDILLQQLNSRPNYKSIPVRNSFISNCWFSKYEGGDITTVHCHNIDHPSIVKNNRLYRGMFSFIYVINDENEKNQTEFIKPTMAGTYANERCEIRFKTSDVEEIREGTIMIFPSSLYHHVNVMCKPGRMVFSGNIYSTFE